MLYPCDYIEGSCLQPCRQTADCSCCACQKSVAKGKFGLAYVVETPRRKYCQPLGWELEFEDTPSNVSNNCRKMAQWVNRPPIGECLEKSRYCCKSIEVTRLLGSCKDKCGCTCQCCPPPKCCPPPLSCCPPPPNCCPQRSSCCPTQVQCPPSPECCPPPTDCCCQPRRRCGCGVKVQYCNCSCLKKSCPCKERCSSPKGCQFEKRCKCRKEQRSSPDRADCSCSKDRHKSKHRKKKCKQLGCSKDDDDSLDYIPRKETSGRKAIGTCDKSSCPKGVQSSDSDKSYNEQKDKSYGEPNSSNTKGDNTRDFSRGGTQLNRTGDNTQMNSTQENNTFGDNRLNNNQANNQLNDTTFTNVYSSTPKNPYDVTRDKTFNPNSTHQRRYNHHTDSTPLLQKIRRAHHKQLEDIEEAKEAELHHLTNP